MVRTKKKPTSRKTRKAPRPRVTVTITELRKKFESFVRRVENGEVIYISRYGETAAKLIRYRPAKAAA
jgi:prevent-host-death family protein